MVAEEIPWQIACAADFQTADTNDRLALGYLYLPVVTAINVSPRSSTAGIYK